MLTRFAIYLLFFLSGISGLAYQIVWMRKLGLVFGSSIFATTVVLICFMSGLALGSYLFGSKLGREKKPLALYALIEALIALTTVVSMFAFFATLQLYARRHTNHSHRHFCARVKYSIYL